MYVSLLSYASGEERVIAKIWVAPDHQVVIDGHVSPQVQEEIAETKQRYDTDEAFLRALPQVFSGSYVRAQFYAIDYGRALKGGPGSGRYPKGSTANTAKTPPPSVLQTMGQPDGGFTYSPTTGRQPHTGFALSIHPDRGQVVDAKHASVVALAKYVVKNWDLLKQKGNYVGGWHHPKNGKVYLDVSTVVQSEKEAESLGRKAKQIAYFDLVQKKSVTIPFTKIPEAYQ